MYVCVSLCLCVYACTCIFLCAFEWGMISYPMCVLYGSVCVCVCVCVCVFLPNLSSKSYAYYILASQWLILIEGFS